MIVASRQSLGMRLLCRQHPIVLILRDREAVVSKDEGVLAAGCAYLAPNNAEPTRTLVAPNITAVS
jgi:hypothetical protein